MIGRRPYAALVVSLAVTLAVLGLASGAQGLAPTTQSTLTVAPKDSNECPRADFHSIQEAIDAAKPGDTVSVCAGTYVEGDADPGSNALTIGHDLNLQGAGADQVTVVPAAKDPAAPKKPA